MKKKFDIDRRMMLKGAGVALALPMLEIMMPSVLRAQSKPKPFIINMVWPDGLPGFYKDAEAGLYYKNPNDPNTPNLNPSGTVKDRNAYYLMEHYLKNMSSELKAGSSLVANSQHNWTGNGFSGHYGNSVGIFSGGLDTRKYKSFTEYKASGSNGDDFMMETYDQRIARHFGLKTSNAILASGAGSIDTFANRRTVESLSWYKHTDGKTHRPVHLDTQPRDLFDRIVGGEVLVDAASIASRRQLLMNKDTVLSAILGDINKLRGRLGMEDKARLDDYLTGIRELDDKTGKDIQALASGNQTQACGAGISRPGMFPYNGGVYSGTYEQKLRLFQDLMTLSMECGQYHVHSLSMGGSGSGLYLKNPSTVPAGMPSHYHSWHGVSHWNFAGGGTESFGNVSAATVKAHQRYQREVYAEYAMMAVDYFKEWMEKLILKKQPDGTSLFDNTFAAITSYIGEGSWHFPQGIPVFMAGTAGGRIPKHNGHHFQAPNVYGIPKGNIWLSVMQQLGINDSQFGGGTGIRGGSRGVIPDFNKPHSS